MMVIFSHKHKAEAFDGMGAVNVQFGSTVTFHRGLFNISIVFIIESMSPFYCCCFMISYLPLD